MKTLSRLTWSCVFCLMVAAGLTAAAATNDLTSALQRGLFEEEANQNLPAAIQAYQSVIDKFDKDRKLVATAIFRLGECYRKQGKTNEASAQYERVLSEFADQASLVNLSRQYAVASDDKSATNTVQPNLAEQIENDEITRLTRLIAESPDLVNSKTDGKTRLHDAASRGQLRVAEFLLRNGADVDAVNPKQTWSTPLQLAVGGGNRAMVELLLKHGAAVNGVGKGDTPLHVAAQRGFRNVAELLLEKGAEVNARNQLNSTPLHQAAANGFKSLTELLVQKGADINAFGTEGYVPNAYAGTPLHMAVNRGHEAVVAVLLAGRPDIRLGDKDGATPLHLAAQKAHAQIAGMLLKAGAKVDVSNTLENRRGWTPLHDAATEGHSSLVGLLLQHGADPNAVAGTLTPLYQSVAGGHLDSVRALLQAKADPNVEVNSYPLLNYGLDAPAILRALLEAGAKPDARLPDQTTALMVAASNKKVEVVKLLLEFKADPGLKDDTGWTPLHYAVSRRVSGPIDSVIETVKALIAADADVNALSSDGSTPLRFALEWNSDILAAELKSHGAQVYAPNFLAVGLTRSTLAQPLIVFRKDSSHWNRYTALEAIYQYYSGATDSGSGTVSANYSIPARQLRLPAGRPVLPSPPPPPPSSFVSAYSVPISQGGSLPFPDMSAAQIRRPRSGKPGDEEIIPLNLSTNIDCTKDVVLQFGDLVDLPERVHSLAEQPLGLDRVQETALKACLNRKVRVSALSRDAAPREIELTIIPQYLSQFLRWDEVRRLLSSSSDLSRVKVKSKDPLTGQPRETVIDLQLVTNGRQPLNEDIWLRDGDVVEVPEK